MQEVGNEVHTDELDEGAELLRLCLVKSNRTRQLLVTCGYECSQDVTTVQVTNHLVVGV
jgi:hypothetical protein